MYTKIILKYIVIIAIKLNSTCTARSWQNNNGQPHFYAPENIKTPTGSLAGSQPTFSIYVPVGSTIIVQVIQVFQCGPQLLTVARWFEVGVHLLLTNQFLSQHNVVGLYIKHNTEIHIEHIQNDSPLQLIENYSARVVHAYSNRFNQVKWLSPNQLNVFIGHIN